METCLNVQSFVLLSGIVNRTLTDPVEQKKVFTYGMVGAFAFRGLSIFAISWLLDNPMLGNSFMLIGGAYLVYLFATSHSPKEEKKTKETWLERQLRKIGITAFWLAVISVEFMDLVFSVDNMVAVVAMSKNLYIIIAAVFVGIVMMRFIAIWFTSLIKKYPALEPAAMWVIFLVGIKLLVSSAVGFSSNYGFAPELTTFVKGVLEDHSTDLIFSGIMLFIFSIPFISREISVLLNNPKSTEVPEACKPVLESLENSKSGIVEQLNESEEHPLIDSAKNETLHVTFVRPTFDGGFESVIDEHVSVDSLEEFLNEKVAPLINEEDDDDEFETDENHIITRGLFLGCKLLNDGSVEISAEDGKIIRARLKAYLSGNDLDEDQKLIVEQLLLSVSEDACNVNIDEIAENIRKQKLAELEAVDKSVSDNTDAENKAASDYVFASKEIVVEPKKRRTRATKAVRDAKKKKATSLPKGWVDATPMTEQEVGDLQLVKPTSKKDAEVPKPKVRKTRKPNVQTK